MNLRGLANGLTRRINPNIMGEWIRATGGYTTSADGRRTQNTETLQIELQVQPMTSEQQRLTDGQGISGIQCSVYMYGNMHGIVRMDAKGGDMLRFPQYPNDAVRLWKVTNAWNWDGWSSATVVMQVE